MTPQEADMIIAEYMGEIFHHMVNGCEISNINYSLSLDALIPVWEKFKEDEGYFDYRLLPLVSDNWMFYARFKKGDNYHEWIEIKAQTIQEAAAIGTAKAIEELKQ